MPVCALYVRAALRMMSRCGAPLLRCICRRRMRARRYAYNVTRVRRARERASERAMRCALLRWRWQTEGVRRYEWRARCVSARCVRVASARNGVQCCYGTRWALLCWRRRDGRRAAAVVTGAMARICAVTLCLRAARHLPRHMPRCENSARGKGAICAEALPYAAAVQCGICWARVDAGALWCYARARMRACALCAAFFHYFLSRRFHYFFLHFFFHFFAVITTLFSLRHYAFHIIDTMIGFFDRYYRIEYCIYVFTLLIVLLIASILNRYYHTEYHYVVWYAIDFHIGHYQITFSAID